MSAPKVPEITVADGYMRTCKVTCDGCGVPGTFTIRADDPRDDEWCNQSLNLLLRSCGWTPREDGDYCDRCDIQDQIELFAAPREENRDA